MAPTNDSIKLGGYDTVTLQYHRSVDTNSCHHTNCHVEKAIFK